MTQKVHGRLIPRLEEVGEGISYGTHKFTDLDCLPIDIPKGKTITISNWNTLVYAEVEDERKYKVIDKHGEKLEVGVDYLIINPKY